MIDRYDALESDIDKLSNYLSREEGKRDKLRENLEKITYDLNNLNNEIDLLDKVTIIFQKTSEFAREQAKRQIESLVTKCLQYVFETDIQFKIEIDELRNKANAEFYVINEEEDMIIKTKPELSRGGGVVDIISLALRIAFMQISKPPIQGPLILDEPAKHVSEEYIYNIGDFLKHSSEMFNRQIIMITHNNHLAAMGNRSYRVDLKGSESSCTLITD